MKHKPVSTGALAKRFHGLFRMAIGAAILLLFSGRANPAVADPPTEPDGSAPTAPFRERVVDMAGDPGRPVTLEVTIMTPEGPGPFPLAVMNHGSPEHGQARADMPRYHRSFTIYYFLSRGYAVAMPMMRGFADSGGLYEAHGCEMERAGLEDARDIAAVIGALALQPDIDASRVVVAGISFGGWNTLAFGTLAGPEVKGLVNFAGGMRESDCDNQDRALFDGARDFGAHARAPSIWLYGENDLLFPPATWRTMYDHYTKAGGTAELFDYGVFGGDAHKFTRSSDSLRVWAPRVDAFLERVGLPATATFPQYLPLEPPPASGFAKIDDFDALPVKSETVKALYGKFLTSDFPRAFVISSKTVARESGGFDPIGRAMAACAKTASDCAIYAYDDQVVWRGPRTLSGTGHVASATVAAGTTATLAFSATVNPDCISRGLNTVRIAKAPEHGVAQVAQKLDFGRFAAGGPYAKCGAVKVPGMAVTYTPAKGFVSQDALTLEVINLDNQDRVVPFAITVK